MVLVNKARSFKDQCRLGSGLTINGRNLLPLATCHCGGEMYTHHEYEAGCCIDCEIAEAKADAAEREEQHLDAIMTEEQRLGMETP